MNAMYVCWAAALCLGVLACSRYENVPPGPGVCRPPQTPPSPIAVFRVDAPGVHGRVLSSSARLDSALVHAGGIAAVSDSAGEFFLPTLPPGNTPIATERRGFETRRDTIVVPDSGGLDVTIRLKPGPPNAGCQPAPPTQQRRRKPWWKWW